MKEKQWQKLLKVSSLFLASLLLSSCFGCAASSCSPQQNEKQVVEVHGLFAYMSLGDAAHDCDTIAYCDVLEKSQPMPSEFLTDPASATGSDYGKKVTIRVKKGLKNCREGDILIYWEPGGEAPDGKIYIHKGVLTAETGDTALIFMGDDGSTPHIGILTEDEDKNVHVPADFMIEEEGKMPDPSVGTVVLPMTEYLEKVEKVIQAQAAG